MPPAFFTDPNVVYVALIIGLWIAVTSAHIPGTGIIEALSLLALGGAVVLLINMPTNWIAVALIVSGVLGFIIIPFLKRQYTTLSLGGLILQAVGGYFLFNGLAVSPVTIGVTIAASLAYHFFLLLPILRQVSDLPSKEETIIGSTGRVVKTLDPIGTVQADGELWTATSDEPLQAGEQVLVTGRDGLQLFVERSKRKRLPHTNHAEKVE